jgi:hypothetical protein
MTDPHWIEFVAAGATVASACVIAWQAVLTRRTLNESKNAVEAAREGVAASREGVAASREGVEASRAAVEVAQRSLTENQIARLEASVPRIWVTAHGIGHNVSERREGKYEKLASTDVFNLPSDAKKIIATTGAVKIRNDGPGAAEVKFNMFLARKEESHAVRSVILAAGETFDGMFWLFKSVEDWIDIAEVEAAKGQPAEAGELVIVYQGPRDADVEETHVVHFYNSVLVEDETRRGTWKEHELWNDMRAVVSPSSRKYWRSRSRKEKFDLS